MIYRSAISGRFVKRSYAKRYPKITVKETAKKKRKTKACRK